MTLPNPNDAVIDIAKLREYCLNPAHPRGRHKARVFESVLGFTTDHANDLRDALLAAVATEEAIAGETDEYGERFAIDFTIKGPKGEGQIRSAWIVRTGEDFPRLTSCYVL